MGDPRLQSDLHECRILRGHDARKEIDMMQKFGAAQAPPTQATSAAESGEYGNYISQHYTSIGNGAGVVKGIRKGAQQ